MASAQAAVGDLETMEAQPGAVPKALRTWNRAGSGRTDGRKPARSMAYRQQSRHEHRVSVGLLRFARTSAAVRPSLAQSYEPPDADPHVRWCGRGGEVTLPPMPITAELHAEPPCEAPLLFSRSLLAVRSLFPAGGASSHRHCSPSSSSAGRIRRVSCFYKGH